jgi:hypothetical protein
MFAIAAVEAGFEAVRLIGKVGADRGTVDIAAQLALDRLQALGIDVHVALDCENPTGKVMVTYLSAGERLLVAEAGANGTFCSADITPGMEQHVAGSDIVFVSGFALVKDARAQAMTYLMEKAAQAGRLVVLDVVPHDIYKMMDRSTFLALTKPVHVVAVEVNTAKRLFFSGDESLPESDVPIRVVADRVLDHYNATILQPAPDYQFTFDGRGLVEEGMTGADQLSPRELRGFSEGIIARLLRRHYTRFAEGTFRA